MGYISSSILTFIPFPYHGGLQEFAIKLACRLRIPLLVIGDKYSVPNDVIEELRGHRIKVYWIQQDLSMLRNPLIVNPKMYYRIARFLKEYDVIHFHGPFPIVGDILLRNNATFIFTYHYDIELRNVALRVIASAYNHLLLSETLRKAKVVTASSKYFIEESSYLKRFSSKVKILPLGVDTSSLIPTFKYEPKIVFVGRIIPEKGIDVLIRAFELASRSNLELKLFVIGKPVDLRYWSHLRQYIWRKGLRDKVILTGYLPRGKMIEVLKSSSILVLPSVTKLDSFGIVLLEASSLAIPIISTTIVPGARELIEKARNGVLIPPGDHYALAEAMKKILENPREYGLRGREYVVKHHDWNIATRIAQQIYKLVLQA